MAIWRDRETRDYFGLVAPFTAPTDAILICWVTAPDHECSDYCPQCFPQQPGDSEPREALTAED